MTCQGVQHGTSLRTNPKQWPNANLWKNLTQFLFLWKDLLAKTSNSQGIWKRGKEACWLIHPVMHGNIWDFLSYWNNKVYRDNRLKAALTFSNVLCDCVALGKHSKRESQHYIHPNAFWLAVKYSFICIMATKHCDSSRSAYIIKKYQLKLIFYVNIFIYLATSWLT